MTLHPLGLLHAMTGDFELARRLVGEANEILDELGRMEEAVSHHEALVELLAGRPAEAEARLRPGYEKLERMGERTLLATTAAMLAQAVYAQDRHAEAAELCRASERIAAPEDVATQALWRGVRAKIRAHEGDLDEADALAHEAVRLVESTDLLNDRGDALLDLAEVLRAGGRASEAEAAARAWSRAVRAQGQSRLGRAGTVLADRDRSGLRRHTDRRFDMAYSRFDSGGTGRQGQRDRERADQLRRGRAGDDGGDVAELRARAGRRVRPR